MERRPERNAHIRPEDYDRLAVQTGRVLDQHAWTEFVADALSSSDLDLVKRVAMKADRWELDGRGVLRSWLPRAPHDAYIWQRLMQGATAEDLVKLVELAERLLPVDALRRGPADDLGLGRGYEADGSLHVILYELRDAPGVGWPLVRAGLTNRVVGCRNAALRVLEGWGADRWPADAASLLNEAMWREPQAKVRQRIRDLLT